MNEAVTSSWFCFPGEVIGPTVFFFLKKPNRTVSGPPAPVLVLLHQNQNQPGSDDVLPYSQLSLLRKE